MLQRQIVVKAFGNQIDIEDPVYRKYAIVDFHLIVWMFVAVSVTIYRNAAATASSSLAMTSFGIPLTGSISAGFTIGFIKG
ncbi:MAG TPA: hypothetical protein VKA91_01530 [Nitrososphaeraceae archaeon]|nr:hypothetical protein [Nitrososphaeraceae archaeon]